MAARADIRVGVVPPEQMSGERTDDGEEETDPQTDGIDQKVHRASLVGCGHSKSSNSASSKTESRRPEQMPRKIFSRQRFDLPSDTLSLSAWFGIGVFIHRVNQYQRAPGNHLQCRRRFVPPRFRPAARFARVGAWNPMNCFRK